MWARAGRSYGEPVSSTPLAPATFFDLARKKGCLFALFFMIALACGLWGLIGLGQGPERHDEKPEVTTSTTQAPASVTAPASATAKPGAPAQPGGPAVPGGR